jgi:site-specific recombinase XerD
MADHLRRFPTEPDDVFLRTRDGGPLSPRTFADHWRRACVKAGAPDVRYHDLRHTFASTLLSRGVSVKAVADWLGYASPVVTLNVYAHLMPG